MLTQNYPADFKLPKTILNNSQRFIDYYKSTSLKYKFELIEQNKTLYQYLGNIQLDGQMMSQVVSPDDTELNLDLLEETPTCNFDCAMEMQSWIQNLPSINLDLIQIQRNSWLRSFTLFIFTSPRFSRLRASGCIIMPMQRATPKLYMRLGLILQQD
jgi:hypothetical protein